MDIADQIQLKKKLVDRKINQKKLHRMQHRETKKKQKMLRATEDKIKDCKLSKQSCERRDEEEAIFEDIITNKFLELVKDMNSQIKAYQTG